MSVELSASVLRPRQRLLHSGAMLAFVAGAGLATLSWAGLLVYFGWHLITMALQHG